MSNFESEKNEMQIDKCALTAHKMAKIPGVRSEVSADFVLPDYMGDVKRLLKYTATAAPCNKFITDSEASFLGIVTFRVTYLDSEDTLTEAVFTKDTECAEKLHGEYSDGDIDYKVQNVTVRLSGPRKISAKASLVSDISLIGECAVSNHADYPDAQTMKNVIRLHTAEYVKSTEREYAEQIDKLSDMSADEVEVVKYDAEAFIDGVHRTEGGINLSGYIDACCVLRTDEDVMRLEKRIPVEEHIELELCDTSAFFPKAYVTGVNLNVNNEAEAESGECNASVVMTMTLECHVAHHKNEEITVVTDAFYEGAENHCSYEDFEYNELIGAVTDKTAVTMSFDRTEEPIHDVIDKEITLKNVKCEISNGEMSVSSDVCVHLVARGSENEDCYSIKHEQTLTNKYRLQGLSENSRIELHTVPCEVSAAFDSEKIYIEAEILVFAIAEEPKKERILSELTSQKEEGECERCVYVYYPEKNDTLWSVSKKYSVCPSKLARCNSIASGLSDENCSVGDMNKIIIVK